METIKGIEPIQHSFVKEIIEKEKTTLFELIEAFGSAVHIILPEIFQENINLFKSILEKYQLKYGILYATKSNKGKSFLEMCSNSNIGVDASSIFELRSALSHGMKGERVGISGPEKSDDFLLLAAKQNSPIAIDSFDEIKTLISFIEKGLIHEKIKILIRIGDIQNKKSRFGISQNQLKTLYEILNEYREYFDFQGFSFHLDGYSIDERAYGIWEAYKEIENARKAGFDCNTIDVGGGFTVNYLDEKNWKIFCEMQSNESGMFYKNRKFSNFYPYYSEHSKETFLDKMLNFRIQDIRSSIHELLKSNDIQLIIEPGRSLLDQAGFTLSRVKGSRAVGADNLIMVDANINNLSEQWFNTDFIPGPLHIARGNTDPLSQTFVASISGNTCMEDDILTWRKIPFKTKPQKGDLLAYINTAGYQMDSNETKFHQLPIPEKITMYKGSGNSIKWKKDSEFSQLDLT